MKTKKPQPTQKWFTKGGVVVSILSLVALFCLFWIGYDHQVKVMENGGSFDKFSAGTIGLFSLLMIFLVVTNFRKFKD